MNKAIPCECYRMRIMCFQDRTKQNRACLILLKLAEPVQQCAAPLQLALRYVNFNGIVIVSGRIGLGKSQSIAPHNVSFFRWSPCDQPTRPERDEPNHSR